MNTKLKCLLLDDELPGLTYLKMLCEQIPELEVVKSFNNPAAFLKEIATLDFDLCILDIEMPFADGLQIANLLNGKPVIFVTAHKDYAAEAFDLNAIDYVRKPVQRERLRRAVQKAIVRIKKEKIQKPFAQLNTDQGKAIIYFGELCYIKTSEMDSRDKTAMFLNGEVMTLKNISFDALKEILPPELFCRINKQEIIALRCVRVFSSDVITTSLPGKAGKPLTLTLSEVYRSDFISKMTF